MDFKAFSFGEFLYENMMTASTREQLTDAQYAVMYLLFKGKTRELQQPYRSMEEKELRILAGLSDQTLRHRKREMSILAGGEDQALKGDEYFEDILAKLQDQEDISSSDLRKTARLYLKFNEMPIQQVAEIAMEAFTDENKEKGEFYYHKNLAAQSKYAQDKKKKDSDEKKRIQFFVSDMTKAFNKKMNFADARKTAIKMAVQKFSKPESEIRDIADGK